MGLMLILFPIMYIGLIPTLIVMKVQELFDKIFNINPEEPEEYIPEATN